MSKYQGLTAFLDEVDEDKLVMSFESINDLIGGDLPESAFKHRPWWANRRDGRGAQNIAWQSVGWETRDVNMELDEVTFVRVEASAPMARGSEGGHRPLTIAQAKAGLAATFGISEDSIDISIRA